MVESLLIAIVGAAVSSLWEHWLGKTNKITENSTVDLAKRLTQKIISKI